MTTPARALSPCAPCDLSDTDVLSHAPPEKQVWGGTLAFLEDPAGNVLSLAEYPHGGE